MKRIVTGIVVWVTLCLMLGVDCQAATIATATKDNSRDTLDKLTAVEIQKYSKSKKRKVTSDIQQTAISETEAFNQTNIFKTFKDTLLTGNALSNDKKDNNNTLNTNNKSAGNKSKKVKSASAVTEKKKAAAKKKYTGQELRYMTAIIYCEARGESYAGQKAVGIVVMNRKRSKEFPNGVKKVIYERGQFSPVRNGSLDRALALYDKYNKSGKFKGEMPSCLKAAKEALEGSTTVKVNGKEKEMKGYLYFSRYISNAKYTLGDHQFK